MAEHDWEALHAALGTATEEHSREELVALLRDLIREYVIERGLPTGTPQQAATPDLGRMDFAQLVGWMKRNLGQPELGLFRVEGDRVIVDADGPRVLSVDRATEPLDPPTAPRPAQAPRAQAPSAPAPAPEAAEGAAEEGEGAERPAPKKLSRGFHGLEFD